MKSLLTEGICLKKMLKKSFFILCSLIFTPFFVRDDRRPPYHEFSAERAYYENVRAPGMYADDPRRDYPGRNRERYPELDHYPGEHFDPRYHEDPREYRDYRDPFEQDIRKYSYIQRERERERERFEADRSRWSPSHPRRPISPSASPSPSDRVSREAERRVYRHSSERSGSCSSLSPTPQFEKSEKSPIEYKTESLDREMEQSEADRTSVTEKSKRGRRKEKMDREKCEKNKSRRGKVQSPSVPYSEVDMEPSLDSNSGKIKSSDVEGLERQRHKPESEPSPSDLISCLDSQKERLDGAKIDSLDRDNKGRSKKHLKSELGNEGKDSLLDSDKLAARKRRFADPIGKALKQKRGRLEDEQNTAVNHSTDFGASNSKEGESDGKTLEKEAQKREHPKSKSERMASHFRDESEHRTDSQNSSGRQEEHSETNPETSESKSMSGLVMPRQFSHDGTPEKDNKGREEYLDIDLSQSYRKQMEQNRRLRQQLQEPDKPGKPETPQSVDTEDFEHRSLVHEVGKPPQDVTDNSPPSKSKKQDNLDMEVGTKRERVYRIFRPKTEESEWSTNSPRFNASQHAEEECTDVPQLITVKEVKEEPKQEDGSNQDMELTVKHIQTSQMSKLCTSLHDEQRRWESRLKQDLLPDFSRGSEKRRLNRSYLEYRLWPDLEPGEVRSDSEEDREHKPNSPMPSTSMSFPDRHRGDRLSESKLTTSLERNKFCSFALDQTITPDTKALLERAKSLSSSREDNWSFLDSDSHFASFRSRKDTEKVESTPRPTPSWYMKKKKIRSESEDKLDDRKEDPKPEEQERRELFASRFLHSSIFEQDSRRLQHLERKHEDNEHGTSYPANQQGQIEGQSDTETVVLFHDRFLELTRLQQQKGKEQSQQESKKEEVVDEQVGDKTQEEEQCSAIEPVEIKQAEISPVQVPHTSPMQILQPLPVQETQKSPPAVTVKEPPPQVCNLEAASPKQLCLSVKEEEKQPEQPLVSLTNPLLQRPSSQIEPNRSESLDSKPLVTEIKSAMKDLEESNDRNVEQCSISETQVTDSQVSHEPKPEPQTELPELQTSPSPMIVDEGEGSLVKLEPVAMDVEPPAKVIESKGVDSYTVEELISPPPRSRNKKGKTSPTTPVAPLTPSNTPDKQSTRKSERIDREKLKRSSSPRVESGKAVSDTKATGKSPIHSPENEQSVEQNTPPVRARRRNVRSVYATPVEDDSTSQAGKDVESPRGARKRGVEKDAGQQQPEPDTLPVLPTARRGRPPKNRRQGEDFSAGKTERSKLSETKETEINETGNSVTVTKVGKGKHSPYLNKGANQGTGMVKKGEKTDKMSDAMTPVELDLDSHDSNGQRDGGPSAPNELKEDHKPQSISETKQDKDRISQTEGTTGSQDKLEESVQEQSPLDRSVKTKTTRITCSSKLMTEDKSLVLKNLRIRLDVTEVKAMLQTGEDESAHDDCLKKVVPDASPKEQILDPSLEKEAIQEDGNIKESVTTSPKIKDPHEALLSRQMELEQAVENIAKLTESPAPLQFKNSAESQAPLSELVEGREEDKPANPASETETELAAAIDSITSEDMSCSLPQDQVISTVIDLDPDLQTIVPDAKVVDGSSSAPVHEDTSNMGTPRKGGKGRPKSQKRAKGQKAAASRKEAIKEVVAEPENLSNKSSESISAIEPTVTEIASTAPAIIAPLHRQDCNVTANIAPEIPKVIESALKEQPDLTKSAGSAARKSPTSLRPQLNPYECTSPSRSPTSICLKPSHPSRLSMSPTDRLNQPKESAVVSPSAPSASPVENPTLQSDSFAHDSNTSDLRKILAKPRGIPISEVSATSGNLHVRESDVKSTLHENRQSSVPVQPVVRQPSSLPSTETKQAFNEKSVISVIASTATSVISRVCNPPESEEKPSLPMANPFVEKQPPKQMYQTSMEEGSTYHGPPIGEEGGNAGRYIVESTSLSTGPTAGLRVNTSEGVVVLSHSGQKLEGRQRISAKISQIPPPSAMDIESQQLVTMPPIKQELYRDVPKGSIPPADHGHSLKLQTNVSTKHESGPDKMDPYPQVQTGVVKRLQQTPGPSQVMAFHHAEYPMLIKHPKKGEGSEPLNVENVKSAWVSTISPAISPHLPSPGGNHVGFIPGTPTDRAPSHIQNKQEPRSPRKSGHPHSPFAKVSSPIGSSSPKAVSMVLSTGLPAMSQYVPSVHHPEQSVIMPPHSTHGSLGRMSPHRVGQSISMGHLSQGDVRVNTPPLSVMNYGVPSEGLTSSWPPGQQRPTSPQAVGNREMVLKVNPASTRGHDASEEEATRRFHPALGRPPATQLKPESLSAEYRSALQSGLPIDRFNMQTRDIRMLIYHPQGDRPAAELHQGHIAEAVPPTSTPTSITASLSPRAHLLQKGVSDKDALKQSEIKRATPPPGKDGMLGIRGALPAIASPKRVQLITTGAVPPFSEYSNIYTNLRTVHSQFPENSPMGISQPPRNITPSQASGKFVLKFNLYALYLICANKLGLFLFASCPKKGAQESDHSQAQTESQVEHVGHQQINMVQLLTVRHKGKHIKCWKINCLN